MFSYVDVTNYFTTNNINNYMSSYVDVDLSGVENSLDKFSSVTRNGLHSISEEINRGFSLMASVSSQQYNDTKYQKILYLRLCLLTIIEKEKENLELYKDYIDEEVYKKLNKSLNENRNIVVDNYRKPISFFYFKKMFFTWDFLPKSNMLVDFNKFVDKFSYGYVPKCFYDIFHNELTKGRVICDAKEIRIELNKNNENLGIDSLYYSTVYNISRFNIFSITPRAHEIEKMYGSEYLNELNAGYGELLDFIFLNYYNVLCSLNDIGNDIGLISEMFINDVKENKCKELVKV